MQCSTKRAYQAVEDNLLKNDERFLFGGAKNLTLKFDIFDKLILNRAIKPDAISESFSGFFFSLTS